MRIGYFWHLRWPSQSSSDHFQLGWSITACWLNWASEGQREPDMSKLLKWMLDILKKTPTKAVYGRHNALFRWFAMFPLQSWASLLSYWTISLCHSKILVFNYVVMTGKKVSWEFLQCKNGFVHMVVKSRTLKITFKDKEMGRYYMNYNEHVMVCVFRVMHTLS